MTRKALFYGYGYRWIRPKDEMSVEPLYERCDPIRRQLLVQPPEITDATFRPKKMCRSVSGSLTISVITLHTQWDPDTPNLKFLRARKMISIKFPRSTISSNTLSP